MLTEYEKYTLQKQPSVRHSATDAPTDDFLSVFIIMWSFLEVHFTKSETQNLRTWATLWNWATFWKWATGITEATICRRTSSRCVGRFLRWPNYFWASTPSVSRWRPTSQKMLLHPWQNISLVDKTLFQWLQCPANCWWTANLLMGKIC